MEKKRQEVRKHEVVGSGNEITIGVIGLGDMGSAAVKALIASGIVDNEHLLVSNRDHDTTSMKLAAAGIAESSVTIAADNDALVMDSDMVIMAVKQKHLYDELRHWHDARVLKEDALVVSFVAGIPTEAMKRWIGRENQSVARVMPNTPVQSGRGYIGWYISPDALVAKENALRQVMDALGKNVQVLEEKQMHEVTAFSGSGVAYAVFHMQEMLEEIARELGVPADIAREMTRETIIGGGIHMDVTGEDGVILRKKVTSPDGTTDRALNKANELGLYDVMKQVVLAGRDRSKEIEDYWLNMP